MFLLPGRWLLLVQVGQRVLLLHWLLLPLVPLRLPVGLVPRRLVGVLLLLLRLLCVLRLGVLRLGVRRQLRLLLRCPRHLIVGWRAMERLHWLLHRRGHLPRYRQRRAQRRGLLLRRCHGARIYGYRNLDRPAEFPGEREGDERTEPGLQLFLHEGIRRRDQRRVLNEAERPGELEPGELACLEAHLGEPLKCSCPHFRQIHVAQLCAPLVSCPSRDH